MIIRSDWHIHSAASYDSSLPLDVLAEKAKEYGFKKVGVTDHVNYNDQKFLGDLHLSAETVNEFRKEHPHILLGVELTPIAKPEFDYIKQTGTREGFVAPVQSEPFGIELAATKEELMALGVRYAVGASHWRVDIPDGRNIAPEFEADLKEWHRQQMWLACDERVTILGHPWYHGNAIWYEDFDLIPRGMKQELAAALKENGKCAECNAHFFVCQKATEKFRRQYAEFLRELFEMGIPITYGSDSHSVYRDTHIATEKYLLDAGFKDGDIGEVSEASFW